MKVRIKHVYFATVTFAVAIAAMLGVTATLLQHKEDHDVYHLEAHISQLVKLVTLPYVEKQDWEGLQNMAEKITTQPGILFLTINGDNGVLAHSHSRRDPSMSVTTKSMPIENEWFPHLNAEVGFHAQHFAAASSFVGQAMIFGTIVLAIIALTVIYLMLVGVMSPLKKLKHLDVSATGSDREVVKDYANNLDATVDMIIDMKNKLEKSYSQLHHSLKEQKYSYSEARQIEEQSEAIYKASHDAIIVANDQDEIVEFSPVAEQIFGWSREEIVGKTMADTIVPPEMREMHIKGMQHFLETGEGPVLDKRIELTALRRSGREFPIEISISAAKTSKGHIFVSYIRDITQRIQNQTELKIAAHAFDTSQPVFIADNKGHIIRSNPAFSQVIGYASEEVRGEKPRSLSANPEDSAFHKRVWRILNQNGSWEGEMGLRHKDGHEIPVFMAITSVADANGELTHYVAHFFDLTEQKRSEQRLREMQAAAENANRAKSRFLAAMSHEIRTPMNGVLGVLGLLKETELNEMQVKLVKTARESGEMLLAIINDILDFSKMEAGKLTLENAPFDMHNLFEQTVDIVRPQAAKKELKLTATIVETVPRYLVGDGDRFRQILLNLLSNAVKYTDTGSINIVIKALHRRPDSVKLQVDVADTGVGIDEKHIPVLFDEFTMADASYNRSHEGSGLGLAICKQLVQQMGGEISAVSQLGHGSVFTFTVDLDIADEKEFQVEAPAPKDIDALEISKNMRILMAEDNPANQVVLRTMLEFSGLSVDIVSNGQEAVDAVSKIPYDIVLMDISMPDVDGMEATRMIRELDAPAKDVVIVALTAHALRGDREHFIKLGMDDFVSKPFTRQAILDCLARWQPKIILEHNMQASSEGEKVVLEAPADTPPAQTTTPAAVVDEATLKQLVKDTSADALPELIRFYVEDARQRVVKIAAAVESKDYYTLEFEAHTLGSSAAAHGNQQLCRFCREIEKHCIEQNFNLAVEEANKLAEKAETAFAALEGRAAKGFTAPK